MNVSGTTKLNGTTTCISTLNISGNTQFNNCSNSGYYAVNNNTSYTVPSIGIYGGIGDKYILFPGSSTTFPYSLGINGATMWYSIPTNSINNWYISRTSYMTLSSTLLAVKNGMTVSGATTCSSTLNIIGNVTTSGLSIFGINSNINNLQATSTSILGLVNSQATSISNLNTTSTTIFNNLNSLSTSSILSINI